MYSLSISHPDLDQPGRACNLRVWLLMESMGVYRVAVACLTLDHLHCVPAKAQRRLTLKLLHGLSHWGEAYLPG